MLQLWDPYIQSSSENNAEGASIIDMELLTFSIFKHNEITSSLIAVGDLTARKRWLLDSALFTQCHNHTLSLDPVTQRGCSWKSSRKEAKHRNVFGLDQSISVNSRVCISKCVSCLNKKSPRFSWSPAKRTWMATFRGKGHKGIWISCLTSWINLTSGTNQTKWLLDLWKQPFLVCGLWSTPIISSETIVELEHIGDKLAICNLEMSIMPFWPKLQWKSNQRFQLK